jgi:gluconokinase
MAADGYSVLVVMGVSGSGKSTIASLLAARLGWEFADADWFHPQANIDKMHAGHPLTDDDRWPWLHAIAAWIDATRAKGGHAVIACSALKRAYRDILIGKRADVGLVYLDGDHDLIARRLTLRNGHFMPPALLDSQFAALEKPGPDERPITVSVAGHPNEIVAAILQGLDAAATAPAGGAA